jgi:SAM-dependent methyltransferase
MQQDPYKDFASVYDDWQRLYPRPFSLALAPRVRDAVHAHGVPTPILADLACGTGTFALWWQKEHPSWTVYGCDASASMIRRAKATLGPARIRSARKAGAQKPGKRPAFLVQDLRETSLPHPAGALTCLFDSLNHILRIPDMRRVFARAREALLPGGLLIFDLIDERAFPKVFTGNSILDGKDLYSGMETEYRKEGGIGFGQARFTFFRRRGSRWRRVEFDVREREWLRPEIRSLLRASGFRVAELQRLDPYRSPEFYVPRTFWVCRRQR